jgi:transcriptional regulator NrdR family protein
MYKTGSELYNKYELARANQWKCEKCNERFPTFKKLRQHKSQNHSY